METLLTIFALAVFVLVPLLLCCESTKCKGPTDAEIRQSEADNHKFLMQFAHYREAYNKGENV